MRGLKRKPLYPTKKLPEHIIGSRMALLEMHYKESIKETDPVAWKRRMDKFTEADRERCKDIYNELRDNGYWVKGIDEYGNLKFGIALLGDVKNLVDSLPLVDRGGFDFRRLMGEIF